MTRFDDDGMGFEADGGCSFVSRALFVSVSRSQPRVKTEAPGTKGHRGCHDIEGHCATHHVVNHLSSQFTAEYAKCQFWLQKTNKAARLCGQCPTWFVAEDITIDRRGGYFDKRKNPFVIFYIEEKSGLVLKESLSDGHDGDDDCVETLEAPPCEGTRDAQCTKHTVQSCLLALPNQMVTMTPSSPPDRPASALPSTCPAHSSVLD